MKIITNEFAYVQKNDIAFLNSTDQAIPLSIYSKVFGDGYTIIDDSNRYDFVKYEKEKDIEFFNNMEWILDYNEVKDLDEKEIFQLGSALSKKVNEIANYYNSIVSGNTKKNKGIRNIFLSKEKRNEIINATNEELEELLKEYNLLNYKCHSIRDYLLYRMGRLSMELPINIDNINQDCEEKKPYTKN